MQVTGNNISSNRLSIRISTGGFSFAINDNKTDFTFDKEDIFYNRTKAICLCEPKLQNDFSNIDIFIESPYCVIPNFIEPTDSEKILDFCYTAIPTANKIITNNIPGQDFYIAYSIDNHLERFLLENFKNANIKHCHYDFLNRAIQSSKTLNNKQVWVEVYNSTAYFTVSDSGNLIMSNFYTISSDNDFAYYTGLVFNCLNLSPHTDSLYIKGEKQYTNIIKNKIKTIININ